MPAIGAVPTIRLVHLVHEKRRYAYYQAEGQAQSIPVRRPAHGQALSSLRCLRCELLMDVRVRSVRGTRWMRRAWFALALPLLVPAALLVSRSSSFPLPDTGGGALLLAVGVALSTLGAAKLLLQAYTDDGVRLSFDGRRWRERHEEHVLWFLR